MSKYLRLFFLLISFSSFGQLAIINDPDGYTNIREEPDGKSEVIHKVYDNQVFWIDYVEGVDEGDWIPAYIPKNMSSFYDSNQGMIRGFIHKSRVRYLKKLKVPSPSEIKFRYQTKSFEKSKHHIQLQDDKWVTFIDGKSVWGTDGEYPRTEIEGITAEINGKKIDIHRAFYSNLYECMNTFKFYKNGSTYFIHNWNSDGAGYYEVVWVLNEDGLIQRLLGTGL